MIRKDDACDTMCQLILNEVDDIVMHQQQDSVVFTPANIGYGQTTKINVPMFGISAKMAPN